MHTLDKAVEADSVPQETVFKRFPVGESIHQFLFDLISNSTFYFLCQPKSHYTLLMNLPPLPLPQPLILPLLPLDLLLEPASHLRNHLRLLKLWIRVKYPRIGIRGLIQQKKILAKIMSKVPEPQLENVYSDILARILARISTRTLAPTWSLSDLLSETRPQMKQLHSPSS